MRMDPRQHHGRTQRCVNLLGKGEGLIVDTPPPPHAPVGNFVDSVRLSPSNDVMGVLYRLVPRAVVAPPHGDGLL